MLVDPLVLLAFLPAVLALNLTPGADMMFCLGQGLRHGSRAALAANVGIAVGAYIQTVIAGLGLGALVATWPIAFDVIRWIGVIYLLYLAWKALKFHPMESESRSTANAFRDGLVGVFAGSIGRQLAYSKVFSKVIGYVSASVFIALALRLTIWERS